MGTVWDAYDEVLHRRVAIKEVNFPAGMPVAEVEQLADRTLREARAVAALSHPNVITLFDILTLPSGPVIVMELLAAHALSEVLRSGGPLTDGPAATVGLAVAAGLLSAHSAGITHRDVKPGNVLIADDGRIKLTDFGIARSTSEHTMTATGMLLGSPAYISPEVASGQPATPTADAWGLGALLFACVQGRPPFDKGDAIATLTAVVMDPVPPHPQSGRLRSLIDALLVKDPAQRMTVRQAHDLLSAVADDPGGMRLHRPAGPSSGAPNARSSPGTLNVHPAPATSPIPLVGPPGPVGRVPSPLTAHAQIGVADAPAPPWTARDASSLRPLPDAAPPRRWRRLLVGAVLIALAAAAIGYFAVRLLAGLA